MMKAQQIKAAISGLAGLKTLVYPFILSIVSSREPGYLSPEYITKTEYRVDNVPITQAMIVKNKISNCYLNGLTGIINNKIFYIIK